MKVWVSRSGTVHLIKDCRMTATNVKHPLQEMDHQELRFIKVCKLCWPKEAHPPKVHHRKCSQCNQRRAHPCKHTGVQVYIDADLDGMILRQTTWVWPERAHRYELVEPPLPV